MAWRNQANTAYTCTQSPWKTWKCVPPLLRRKMDLLWKESTQLYNDNNLHQDFHECISVATTASIFGLPVVRVTKKSSTLHVWWQWTYKCTYMYLSLSPYITLALMHVWIYLCMLPLFYARTSRRRDAARTLRGAQLSGSLLVFWWRWQVGFLWCQMAHGAARGQKSDTFALTLGSSSQAKINQSRKPILAMLICVCCWNAVPVNLALTVDVACAIISGGAKKMAQLIISHYFSSGLCSNMKLHTS